jgi:hypothetical protein
VGPPQGRAAPLGFSSARGPFHAYPAQATIGISSSSWGPSLCNPWALPPLLASGFLLFLSSIESPTCWQFVCGLTTSALTSWSSSKSLSRGPSPPPQMLAQSQAAIGISSVRGPSHESGGGSSGLLFYSWALPPFRKIRCNRGGKRVVLCSQSVSIFLLHHTPPPLTQILFFSPSPEMPVGPPRWSASWALHTMICDRGFFVGPLHRSGAGKQNLWTVFIF